MGLQGFHPVPVLLLAVRGDIGHWRSAGEHVGDSEFVTGRFLALLGGIQKVHLGFVDAERVRTAIFRPVQRADPAVGFFAKNGPKRLIALPIAHLVRFQFCSPIRFTRRFIQAPAESDRQAPPVNSPASDYDLRFLSSKDRAIFYRVQSS